MNVKGTSIQDQLGVGLEILDPVALKSRGNLSWLYDAHSSLILSRPKNVLIFPVMDKKSLHKAPSSIMLPESLLRTDSARAEKGTVLISRCGGIPSDGSEPGTSSNPRRILGYNEVRALKVGTCDFMGI